jgi:hypothetical protein
MTDTQYTIGYKAGMEYARNQILKYIQHHFEMETDITSEDIANEIEYIQRQEIREKNNG